MKLPASMRARAPMTAPLDHHQRADHGIGATWPRVDHGAGMDAGGRHHLGQGLEQLRRTGEIGVGIARDDAGAGIACTWASSASDRISAPPGSGRLARGIWDWRGR
jgi:hypothetical protein